MLDYYTHTLSYTMYMYVVHSNYDIVGVLCNVISLSTVVLSIQVNEKSFDLKEGI